MSRAVERNRPEFRRTFFRYLIFYLVFAFAFLCSDIPILRYISDNTLEQTLDKYQSTLRSDAQRLDNTISTLSNAVSVTYRDQRLSKLKYLNATTEDINRIDFNSMTTFLNAILITHNMIGDAAIIFSNDIVLTRQRSFLIDSHYSYYPDFFKCSDYSYKEWHDMLIGKASLLPVMRYSSADYGTYNAITYVSPWSETNYSSKNIFMATLPVDRLLAVFIPDHEFRENYYFRLDNSEGNALYEYGAEHAETCHMITIQSPLWLLQITLGVPNRIVDNEISSVRNKMIFYGAALLLFTFCMVLLFAHFSAHPIRKIMNKMISSSNIGPVLENKIASERKSSYLLHEYNALDESLQDIEESIEHKNQIIQEQNSMIRTQMMDMALRGGLYRPEELNLFKSAFEEFPSLYQLSLMYYDSSASKEGIQMDRLQIEILNAVRHRIPEAYIQGFEGTAVLCLLPRRHDSDNDWKKRMSELREELTKLFLIPFSYAISDTFSSPQDLARAYQQIQCMKVFTAYNQYSVVENVETAKHRTIQLPLSIGTIQILHSALSNGNYTVAINTLSECIQALPEPQDYLLHKHTYTMVANLIVQLKLENPEVLFDVVVPSFSMVQNKTDFAAQFDKTFQQICTYIQEARQTNIDDFSLDVMKYINVNISNQDLCISSVISQFDISAPTLQKIMRNATGTTFSGYVESQRLSKAYLLLTTGTETIQSIAEQCGFASANSFYKVFKRRYGFSPSALQQGEIPSMEKDEP